MPKKPDPQTDPLVEELRKVNAHHFMRAHETWLGMIGCNLVRGLAFGLGSVIGATVLVYLLISFLSSIDFVPIIGEYAKEIIDLIQASEK